MKTIHMWRAKFLFCKVRSAPIFLNGICNRQLDVDNLTKIGIFDAFLTYGERSTLRWSWKPNFGTASGGLLGIEVSSDGVAVVEMDDSPQGPVVRHCHLLSAEAETADAFDQLTASRLPCNWVLSSEQYSLLLLEAPKVAPEEMHEAVRWQIKDLINFPADQAVLDIFDLPEAGSRSRHMIYAVAAQRKHIEAIRAQSRAARLKLSSIDIGELALRNIALLLPADERGLAIVRIQQGQGSLVLIRQGQLYLSRQFELPYQAGVDESLPEDNLILELQRSLDYYERQMAQAPPARILLCGDNIRPEKITDSIRSSLPAQVECLQLATLLQADESFDEALLQRCVGAIGAALRKEETA